MPAFKFLAELLTGRKFKNLSQSQNEALIDVLTAAKAIDGVLKDVEREELMEIVEKLDWKAGEPIEMYIDKSIRKATELEPVPGQLGQFCEDIGDRLEEKWLKEEAYHLAARVAMADDEVVNSERLLLQHLVEGLNIDSKRQQLIMRKLRDQIDLGVTIERTAEEEES